MQDITSYSKGLMWGTEEISYSQELNGTVQVQVGDLMFKGGTIWDIASQIKSLENLNKNVDIIVEVIYDESIKKQIRFKFKDFWYSIDSSWIIWELKKAIISGKSELFLDAWNYIFLDEKLLSKRISDIQEAFKVEDAWSIVYSSEKDNFQVDNTNSVLYNYISKSWKLPNYKKELRLQETTFKVLYNSDKNVLFDQIEALNNTINTFKNFWVLVPGSSYGINTHEIESLSQVHEDKLSNLVVDEDNIKLYLEKWFLLKFLSYNQDLNNLVLDEEKFENYFGYLKNITLNKKPAETILKASVLTVKEGWISENFPTSSDVQSLSYGNPISLDFELLKRSINSIVPKITPELSLEENYEVLNAWKEEIDFKKLQTKVETIDSKLISKKEYDILKWVYENGDVMVNHIVNIDNFRVEVNDDTTSFNTCFIEKNRIIVCWEENEKVWEFTVLADWIKFRAEDNEIFNSFDEIDTDFEKKWGSIFFPEDKITLLHDGKINTIYLNIDRAAYVHEVKEKIIPGVLQSRVNAAFSGWEIKFRANISEWQYIIIKEDPNKENYYFFLIEINAI